MHLYFWQYYIYFTNYAAVTFSFTITVFDGMNISRSIDGK